MALVRQDDGGVSILLAYSMYYIWGTRLLAGRCAYDFALYPFTGPWRETGLHRRAPEYDSRRRAGREPGDGRLGESFAPLRADSDAGLVSALCPRGGRVYARLYEHTGAPGRDAPLWRRRLTEVNLPGAPMAPAASPLRFRPFQFRTFRRA